MGSAARILDVHSDATHNRSVFTVAGETEALMDALATLARACRSIDLRTHTGVHPRLGGLDVCPIVAYGIDLTRAAALARSAAEAIAERARLPVYLYGAAATRPETRELPELRRGGLRRLMARAATGLPPDIGPRTIDARHGVVCVGARGVLIAFNVWFEGDVRVARAIAGPVDDHRRR
jgi:glutamate formiminotransferase